jgi:glycosyltransferase involved in cell wall biosynthesis
MPGSILIFCPDSGGGTAEHARYQARALAEAGLEVTLLCSADYAANPSEPFKIRRVFPAERGSKQSSRIARVLRHAWRLVSTQWRLAWEVAHGGYRQVLIASYGEYLSLFWVWPHLILSSLRGVTYVANLHDPVRDFRVGPVWWHEWSVSLAYAPLTVCIVHKHLDDPSVVPPHIRVVEAPVGVYDLSPSRQDASVTRAEWGVPPSATVFFSFGFIRDNKNIDLLIRALPPNPSAWVVVMGRVQSATSCKPVSFYLSLAEELGVADRVVILEQFVPDDMLGAYFAAADVLALTYAGSFHSQSGVLNIVARADKPVLASAGESPLKESVLRFHLGLFVAPDDADAIAPAMGRFCEFVAAGRAGQRKPKDFRGPDWNGYRQYASWETNVRVILDTVAEVKRNAEPKTGRSQKLKS